MDFAYYISVFVTGFGPFKSQYPVNPSWQIARLLPEYLPPLRPKAPRPSSVSKPEIPPVRILVHPEAVRVNYEVVRDLVPKLWRLATPRDEESFDEIDDITAGAKLKIDISDESKAADEADRFDVEEDDKEEERKKPKGKPKDGHGGRRIDLMIHIGMAGSKPVYCIERRGHRDGYLMPDVDGKLCDDTTKPLHGRDWVWYGLPRELKTDLDVEDVLERWRDNSPDGHNLQISEDAGHYLCDFIYFSSLAHLHRAEEPRRVVFLHVPSDASDSTVQVGRELVIQLIRSVVESEVERRKKRKKKPDDGDEL
jgi:pyrrolidone-carboxylate peptidase